MVKQTETAAAGRRRGGADTEENSGSSARARRQQVKRGWRSWTEDERKRQEVVLEAPCIVYHEVASSISLQNLFHFKASGKPCVSSCVYVTPRIELAGTSDLALGAHKDSGQKKKQLPTFTKTPRKATGQRNPEFGLKKRFDTKLRETGE